MANWIHRNNVKVDGVFKKLDLSDTYLIKLEVPNEKSIFSDPYEILIQSNNMYEQLTKMVEGKKKRCYFSYGMSDIDFYKVEDKFALTDSPSPGCNVQFIFADGEIERLINSLKLSLN